MAVHTNEVSQTARMIFSDVCIIGKRVLDRFYEGFSIALKDVHKKWRHLKPRERKIVFEKVQNVAKELIVDKTDGGSAENGLSLGTFRGYVCKVKRALIYHVPLHIAEHATNPELQKAQKYVEEILGGIEGDQEEKMTKAYQWVKEEQIKAKDALRKKAAEENQGKKPKPSLQTAFTLPDPDDYETGDADSDALLQSGIQSMLVWLQNKPMQQHLDKKLASAKTLRHVLGELLVYEDKHNSEKKVA